MYTIWTRSKDGQMYAELPGSFSSKKYFIALTIASGDLFAGYQIGDLYVYWRRYDKRMALMTPNVEVRSTGDAESKASVKRIFTDRMLLDVPIVTMGPGGGPVIDMDSLLVGRASSFFGPFMPYDRRSLTSLRGRVASRLYSIKKAKAFPKNVELAFEVPMSDGKLQTLHYSISEISGSAGYKTRKADERVGYFVTAYSDYGKYSDKETRTRYINRWHLEKADSKLKISPPKEPITFYIEHTTPVRYRRWVRAGILSWNKAFERIGISNAIEVNYQDPRKKVDSHMEKDPEDVRWNFIRWLNNDYGLAIGPSRVNPMTGEILDADIILTDGWIRSYRFQFEDLLPEIAMQGFSSETLAWLADHPDWDPRILLAAPARRTYLKAQAKQQAALPFGRHPAANVDPRFMGDNPLDGLIGRTSQVNGMCFAAKDKGFDMALMRMHLRSLSALAEDDPKETDEKDEEKEKKEEEDKEKKEEKEEQDEEKKEDKDKEDDKKKEDDEAKKKKKDDKKKKKDESTIDGMPEAFIGPLMAHLVAHEVGHTLGLRHNFKASSIYSLAEINSDKFKGKKTLAGSVMDYVPVNINFEGGKLQGDYAMTDIGPYDYWAIEYGYTFDKSLKPILDRVAEPELQYATDEDTYGPDPLARMRDLGKDPLDYAKQRIRLTKYHRKHIIDDFVKEGESWARARYGYEMTLMLQTHAVGMMANWVGGAYVSRDKKGDKDARVPIRVVSAEQQRAALKFTLENMFPDDAFGLTPELLSHMTQDKWLDGDDYWNAFEDAPWPIHDRIAGMQSSTLTMLMKPSTLRRVYDNEFRVSSDDDMLTLPELLSEIGAAIWTELGVKPEAQHTARKPMISSLRRNLQREHLKRLTDLAMTRAGTNAAARPISDLASMELRKLKTRISAVMSEAGDKIDPYTRAHLTDAQERITKALDAQYVHRVGSGGGSSSFFFFSKEENPLGEASRHETPVD